MWKKAELAWRPSHCCFFPPPCTLDLSISAVFVNADHELHNVSGHLSVNWICLITEMKRENPAKYLFYGILLWKLPSVEQLSEEEVFVGVQSIFPGHKG
ncbi:unnamed protein product [Porites lobata]|uniref:Uncharacterized protein n=1 Tax=Porites lobata TaxID=104759 RepID=A0ABN8NRC7_9CNID|nr:unnamed protein product [Porites lobata]